MKNEELRKPAPRAFLFDSSTQYSVPSTQQWRDRGVRSHLSRSNKRAERNHNVLNSWSSGTVGPDAFCPGSWKKKSAAKLLNDKMMCAAHSAPPRSGTAHDRARLSRRVRVSGDELFIRFFTFQPGQARSGLTVPFLLDGETPHDEMMCAARNDAE